MKPFVQAINEVLKYGRLRTKEEYGPVMDQVGDHKEGISGQGNPEGEKLSSLILADFLQDEDDPRADIVRRHCEKDPSFKYPSTPKSESASHSILLPDQQSSLLLTGYENGIRVGWHQYRNHTNSPTGFFGYPFHAMYSPTELRELAGRFPDETAGHIKTYLDKNYPEQK
jgi:hypothetical protein